MIISVKLAIRCLYNFKNFRHTYNDLHGVFVEVSSEREVGF